MKKLLFTSIIGLSLVLLAACGSDGGEDELANLKEEGVVKVGFANEEPYAYKEGDEIKGAAVDIAEAVFKELGVDEIDPQLADFSELIPSLKANKFDVVTAGMAITPDRCKNVSFGEPEMKYGEGLIVKKGNPKNLKSYKDIADNSDIKVSVMSGATENEFLESEGVDEDQIQSASDIPATFSAVSSGRADATTGTEMTIKMALESSDNDDLEFVESFEQPDVEGNPSYGAAAFRDDSDELRKAYNEKLKELKEDGTVAELLEKNGFSEEMNTVESEVTAKKVCDGEY